MSLPTWQEFCNNCLSNAHPVSDVPHADREIGCPICLNEYMEGDEPEPPVQLPCRHFLGQSCAINWFRESLNGVYRSSCPACRAQVYQQEHSHQPDDDWFGYDEELANGEAPTDGEEPTDDEEPFVDHLLNYEDAVLHAAALSRSSRETIGEWVSNLNTRSIEDHHLLRSVEEHPRDFALFLGQLDSLMGVQIDVFPYRDMSIPAYLRHRVTQALSGSYEDLEIALASPETQAWLPYLHNAFAHLQPIVQTAPLAVESVQRDDLIGSVDDGIRLHPGWEELLVPSMLPSAIFNRLVSEALTLDMCTDSRAARLVVYLLAVKTALRITVFARM